MSQNYDVKYNLQVNVGNSLEHIRQFQRSLGKLNSAFSNIKKNQDDFSGILKQFQSLKSNIDKVMGGTKGISVNIDTTSAKAKLTYLSEQITKIKAIAKEPVTLNFISTISGGQGFGSKSGTQNELYKGFTKTSYLVPDKIKDAMVAKEVAGLDQAKITAYNAKMNAYKAKLEKWKQNGKPKDKEPKKPTSPYTFSRDYFSRDSETPNGMWRTPQIANSVWSSAGSTGYSENVGRRQPGFAVNKGGATDWNRLNSAVKSHGGTLIKESAAPALSGVGRYSNGMVSTSSYNITGYGTDGTARLIPGYTRDNLLQAKWFDPKSLKLAPSSQPTASLVPASAGTGMAQNSNDSQKILQANKQATKTHSSMRSAINNSANAVNNLANATSRLQMQLAGVGGNGMKMTINTMPAQTALSEMEAFVRMAVQRINTELRKITTAPIQNNTLLSRPQVGIPKAGTSDSAVGKPVVSGSQQVKNNQKAAAKSAATIHKTLSESTNSVNGLANATNNLRAQLAGVGGKGLEMNINTTAAEGRLTFMLGRIRAFVEEANGLMRGLGMGNMSGIGPLLPQHWGKSKPAGTGASSGAISPMIMRPGSLAGISPYRPMFHHIVDGTGAAVKPETPKNTTSSKGHAGNTATLPGNVTVPKAMVLPEGGDFVRLQNGQAVAMSAAMSPEAIKAGYAQSAPIPFKNLPMKYQSTVNTLQLQRSALHDAIREQNKVLKDSKSTAEQKALATSLRKEYQEQVKDIHSSLKQYQRGFYDTNTLPKDIAKVQSAAQRAVAANRGYEAWTPQGVFYGGNKAPSFALDGKSVYKKVERARSELTPKEEAKYTKAEALRKQWEPVNRAIADKIRSGMPLTVEERAMHTLSASQLAIANNQMNTLTKGYTVVDKATGIPLSKKEYDNRNAKTLTTTQSTAEKEAERNAMLQAKNRAEGARNNYRRLMARKPYESTARGFFTSLQSKPTLDLGASNQWVQVTRHLKELSPAEQGVFQQAKEDHKLWSAKTKALTQEIKAVRAAGGKPTELQQYHLREAGYNTLIASNTMRSMRQGWMAVDANGNPLSRTALSAINAANTVDPAKAAREQSAKNAAKVQQVAKARALPQGYVGNGAGMVFYGPGTPDNAFLTSGHQWVQTNQLPIKTVNQEAYKALQKQEAHAQNILNGNSRMYDKQLQASNTSSQAARSLGASQNLEQKYAAQARQHATDGAAARTALTAQRTLTAQYFKEFNQLDSQIAHASNKLNPAGSKSGQAQRKQLAQLKAKQTQAAINWYDSQNKEKQLEKTIARSEKAARVYPKLMARQAGITASRQTAYDQAVANEGRVDQAVARAERWAQQNQHATTALTSGWKQEKVATAAATPAQSATDKALTKARADLDKFRGKPARTVMDNRGWFVSGHNMPSAILDDDARWVATARNLSQLTLSEREEYRTAKTRAQAAREGIKQIKKAVNTSGVPMTAEQKVQMKTFKAQESLARQQMNSYTRGYMAVDKTTGEALNQSALARRGFGAPSPSNLGYKLFGPTPLPNNGGMAIGMLKGMGVMYGITGIGSMIGNIVNASANYGNTMKLAEGIMKTTDDNPETFASRYKSMERTIRNIGIETKYDVTEVADAAKFLAMAGLDVNQVKKSMPHIANIALIGDTDLGETADLMTNVMTGYDIPMKKMGQVADMMTTTFSMSNVTLPEIAEAFKYSASLFNAGHVDFAEAVSAIGILGDAGLKGSSAGTTMRTILSNLVFPRGKKKTAAWNAWKARTGIKVIDDETGELNSLVEIFKGLTPENIKLAEYYGLFDKTAAQGAVALARHVDKWEKVRDRNRNDSRGVAVERADLMKNTIKGLWAQFTSSVTELGLKAFSGTQGFIQDKLRGMIEWAQSSKGEEVFKDLFVQAQNLIAAFGKITQFFLRLYQNPMFRWMTNTWIKMQLYIWPIVKALTAFKSMLLAIVGIGRLGSAARNVFGNLRTLAMTPGGLSVLGKNSWEHFKTGGITPAPSLAQKNAYFISKGENGRVEGGLYQVAGKNGEAVRSTGFGGMVMGPSPTTTGTVVSNQKLPDPKGSYLKRGWTRITNWASNARMSSTGMYLGGAMTGLAGGLIGGYAGQMATGDMTGTLVGSVLGSALAGPLVSAALSSGPVGAGIAALVALLSSLWFLYKKNSEKKEARERMAKKYAASKFSFWQSNPDNPFDLNETAIRAFEIRNSNLLNEQNELKLTAKLWKDYYDSQNPPKTEVNYDGKARFWHESEDNLMYQAESAYLKGERAKRHDGSLPAGYTEDDQKIALTVGNQKFSVYSQVRRNLEDYWDPTQSAKGMFDNVVAGFAPMLYNPLYALGSVNEQWRRNMSADQLLQTQAGHEAALANFRAMVPIYSMALAMKEFRENGHTHDGSGMRYLMGRINPIFAVGSKYDIGSQEYFDELSKFIADLKKSGQIRSTEDFYSRYLPQQTSAVESLAGYFSPEDQQWILDFMNQYQAAAERWRSNKTAVIQGSAIVRNVTWGKYIDDMTGRIQKAAQDSHGVLEAMKNPFASSSYSIGTSYSPSIAGGLGYNIIQDQREVNEGLAKIAAPPTVKADKIAEKINTGTDNSGQKTVNFHIHGGLFNEETLVSLINAKSEEHIINIIRDAQPTTIG